jgi:hypothetical protein
MERIQRQQSEETRLHESMRNMREEAKREIDVARSRHDVDFANER